MYIAVNMPFLCVASRIKIATLRPALPYSDAQTENRIVCNMLSPVATLQCLLRVSISAFCMALARIDA